MREAHRWVVFLCVLLCGLLYFITGNYSVVLAQSSTPETSLYVTNGSVYDMKESNDTLFIGGTFTYVGPNTGKGTIANANTFSLGPIYPRVEGGKVMTAISDGAGGFFIGGSFTSVGGITRNRLAHISSDGTLDANWNPNMGNNVASLALSPDNSTLYAGGSFTSADGGGTARNYLAAFRTTPQPGTCTVDSTPRQESFEGGVFPPTDWTTSGTVNWSFDTDAGDFQDGVQGAQSGTITHSQTSVLETTAVMPKDGELKFYWKVSSQSNYDFLYVCIDNSSCTSASGYTTRISGTVAWTEVTIPLIEGTHTLTWKYSKNASTSTGSDKGWIDNVRVYAYESHPCGGGTSVTKLWNPNVGGNVEHVELSSDDKTVFAGGSFTTANGSVSRSNFAAFGPNGVVTPLNPGASNVVWTMARSGNSLYVGGSFTTFGGVAHQGVALIDLGLGTVSSWNPKLNSYPVQSMAIYSNTLYIGGWFDRVGSALRNKLAVFDTTTGNLLPMTSHMDFDANVHAMAVDNSKLIVAGALTMVAGKEHRNIFRLDSEGNVDDTWNPSTNSTVLDITKIKDRIYLGGYFTNVNGVTRNYIAAVNEDTGALENWDPVANGHVRTLEAVGEWLFMGGSFSTVHAYPRLGVAKLSYDTDIPFDWNPRPVVNTGSANWSEIYDFERVGDTLYFGGDFDVVAGQNRSYVAGVDMVNGATTSFAPQLDSTVYAIAHDTENLYVGGLFSTVNSLPQDYVAAFSLNNGSHVSWDPQADGEILKIVPNKQTLILSGWISMLGGYSREYVGEVTVPNVSCPAATQSFFSESFESDPFPSSEWTSYGDVPWSISTTEYQDGLRSAKTGTLATSQMSALETEVTLASESLLSFSWKTTGTDMEEGGIIFCLDNPRCGLYEDFDRKIGGYTEWENVLYRIPAGTHTLTWKLILGGGDSTSGVGWLDTVSISDRGYCYSSPAQTTSFYPISLASYDPPDDMLLIDDSTLYVAGSFTTLPSDGVYNDQGFAIFGTNPVDAGSRIDVSYPFQEATENITSPVINVITSKKSSSPLSVSYTVTGGSAQGSGIDYTLTNGTITIPSNTYYASIPFTVVDDLDTETNEALYINFSDPVGGVLGTLSSTTYKILDNDGGGGDPENTPTATPTPTTPPGSTSTPTPTTPPGATSTPTPTTANGSPTPTTNFSITPTFTPTQTLTPTATSITATINTPIPNTSSGIATNTPIPTSTLYLVSNLITDVPVTTFVTSSIVPTQPDNISSPSPIPSPVPEDFGASGVAPVLIVLAISSIIVAILLASETLISLMLSPLLLLNSGLPGNILFGVMTSAAKSILIAGTDALLGPLGILLLRRQNVGVVFNSLNSNPVSRAHIVFFSPSGRAYTTYSRADGYYSVHPFPGSYQIYVMKIGYRFPSRYVTHQAKSHYSKIYHYPDYVEISKNALVDIALPLDPVQPHLVFPLNAPTRLLLLSKKFGIWLMRVIRLIALPLFCLFFTVSIITLFGNDQWITRWIFAVATILFVYDSIVILRNRRKVSMAEKSFHT